MGAVKHNCIYAFVIEGAHPVKSVRGDAYAGGYPEAAETVLAGIGIESLLDEVLVSDQTYNLALVVNYRELFDFVFLENRLDIFTVGVVCRDGDKPLRSHCILDKD